MKKIQVGFGTIGLDQPCYLIAEVGTTCMGDLDKALQLVVAAKEAGVNAVKFQVIDPNQLSDSSVTYPVNLNGKVTQTSMKDMFEKLVFDEASWKKIADKARSLEIDFFATVDYLEGVDMLDRIGVAVHKIGAWDATFEPLIKHIGKTGKPMFADMGPTTVEEADNIVKWYIGAGGGEVLFMHDFHTQDDLQMNLNAINHLNKRYPWPAGFSSPALDHDLDIAALALGAAYLEKRLILSRNEIAFHAHESCEPSELKSWVERIRHVERALGQPEITPSTKDLEGKEKYYRSICTLQPIKAGEVFSSHNLGAKRPGVGIETSRLIDFFGRKAATDLPANKLLAEEDKI
jgi:sialic acid synthase SpsE